jgi:hypothetical protein
MKAVRALLPSALVFGFGCFLPIFAIAQPLPRFGLAAGVSTLGVGVQAATAVTRRSNVRFGFNAFSYEDTVGIGGVPYDSTLSLRSAEVVYDLYIAGPLHISPGLMVYDGNEGNGTTSIAPGQSFRVGGVTYVSQPGNPVSGTVEIDARKAAPMILIGVGNLLPRNRRRLTVNFEAGVVFQGSPNSLLRLIGGACNPGGSACVDAATNPLVQATVQSEQARINNELTAFRYYPVVSLTFGYRF